MARFGRSYIIHAHFKKPPFFGPFFLKISGIVNKSGVPQAGAKVYLVDETTDTLVGYQVTDGAGAYKFTSAYGLISTHKYHAAVEYDDGVGSKYNAKSLPYLSPVAM